MSKKSRFRGCFEKQYGTHAQVLLKFVSQNVYHSHYSVDRKLCLKKSLLLTCQILGVLVNTLATDEKYPVLHREILMKPIHIQYSQKGNALSQFFVAFLKLKLNFKYFEKKDDLHSFCISEIRHSVNVAR